MLILLSVESVSALKIIFSPFIFGIFNFRYIKMRSGVVLQFLNIHFWICTLQNQMNYYPLSTNLIYEAILNPIANKLVFLDSPSVVV